MLARLKHRVLTWLYLNVLPPEYPGANKYRYPKR